MEQKDPILERRRREAENNEHKKLKVISVVLAVVAILLACVLAFLWIKNNDMINQLNSEKEDLTEQVQNLQKEYNSLSSDYASINSQLDTSRAEVARLLASLKKTQATDRARIRKYQKELGTLRAIMRNYIVQIDSLNTLNHKLTADAAAARKEAAESKRQNVELSQQVQTLTGQVEAGSVVKARALRVIANNVRDRETNRSSRVKRLITYLSLVENDLAKKGPLTVYIRVINPSGNVLTNSRSSRFTCNGKTMMASASRVVDYEGKEVELGIYLNDIKSYTKGVYKVEAYTDQSKLGEVELMLR